MNPLPDAELEDISRFFRRFETADGDGSRYAELFAEVFLSLDPGHVNAVPGERLIAYLPARNQMFSAMGVAGLDFGEVRDAVRIDAQHVLASTTWTARLLPGRSREPLQLDSTYLLRREAESWRIVVYLNHQDMAEVVARRSGVPG